MTAKNQIPKEKIAEYKPSTIVFYNYDGEIILREPTLVALDKKYPELIRYVGKDVENIPEEILEDVIVGSPFRNGAVADFDTASYLIYIFLKARKKRGFLVRPRIAVCTETDLTDVENRALVECMYKAGARDVLIINHSFSSAVHKISPKYSVIIEIS